MLVEGAPPPVEAIASQVELLEHLARDLSLNVSDTRLLKELLQLKEPVQCDLVNFSDVLDEIKPYARFRTTSQAAQLLFSVDLPANIGVRTVSRDLLSTALRNLVRTTVGRLKRNGAIEVRARVHELFCVLEVTDNGQGIDPEIARRVMLNQPAALLGDQAEDSLRAVANLAWLSKGRFEIAAASASGMTTRMVLTLPCQNIVALARQPAGYWALLVDNSPEVTTFYARVAEALNLKFFTAMSVREAEEILRQNGKPRLVITDIKLGESSGLDLVRTLRSQFDRELPIIVVSGNAGDGIADEVRAAGATQYLVKPVSRRKLFTEIKQILAN
jgi:two-component system chemotaxis response regulator CheY